MKKWFVRPNGVALYLTILFIFFAAITKAQIITTIAGNGTPGFSGDGFAATLAQLNLPHNLTLDKSGNMYISDGSNFRIRKLSPSGIISTIAGTGTAGYNGDGILATVAQISGVFGLALDDTGNLYFADLNNSRLRKIDTFGVITTIAGTGVFGYNGDDIAATTAQLRNPIDVAIDNYGNIFLSDEGSRRIRKITGGIIATVVGTGILGYSGDGGPATAAKISDGYAIAFDKMWNLYIADHAAYNVRKVDVGGTIYTVTGNGTAGFSGDGGLATAAIMDRAAGVAVDGCGNIYISDQPNYRIRKINPAGIITTITGNGVAGYFGDGGLASLAQINGVVGIKADALLNVYFADAGNNVVRKISSNNHAPSFTAGHVQNLVICKDTPLVVLNAMLAASDLDTLQQETWSVAMPPLHGTLIAAYSAASTGGTITPMGLSYTPTTGFVGNDSFKVTVRDCGNLADTTMVYVRVNGCTLGTPSNLPEREEVLRVSPNPAKDELIISADCGSYNTIVITNTFGQVLISQQMITAQTKVSVKALPVGLYYLTVRGRAGLKTEKFVKE
jgi:Secretion system C-terminal sorting domain/Bacterial Ig domain